MTLRTNTRVAGATLYAITRQQDPDVAIAVLLPLQIAGLFGGPLPAPRQSA